MRIYRSVCEFRDGSAVDDITVLVVRFGGRRLDRV